MRVAWRDSSCVGFSKDSSPTIGSRWRASDLGVREIRIHTGLEHRVFYVAKFDDAVYVLHAFEKRTRKTLKHDLELARSRLRALLARRKARDGTARKKDADSTR